MSAYKRPDRDNHWWYRRTVKLPSGKRVRIHGPGTINTKASAENAERDHIKRLIDPPPPEPTVTPRLRDFSVEFMKSYAAANNKPSEIDSKRWLLDTHILPALGDLPIGDITPRELETFKASLLAGDRRRKLSRKSVNNTLAVVSKMLRFAAETEVISRVPRIKLLKVDASPFRFLSFEEYDKLVAAAEHDPLWHLGVLLAGDAGLRRGEFRALEWRDWKRDANRIVVERSEWNGEVGSTKGWKVRELPLTKRLAAALKSYRHLRGPRVLCGPGGEPLTKEQLRWNIAKLSRKAGIDPEIGWHCLRHTFCSHLAMRGAPAKAIQELAGHADLATTLKYMHLTPDAREQAIALLDSPWPQRGPSDSQDAKKPRKS